jgi:hypothetical protein
MSLKYEQKRAIKQTRDFLSELLTINGIPKTKKELRQKASRCLKHFPPLDKDNNIMWSNDNFEE